MTVESQIHFAVADLVAPGARIDHVHRYRSSPLPFPARLALTIAQQTIECVVKISADQDRSAHEARVLRALEDLDFPAPRLMAGPHVVPTADGPITVLVMTQLPGAALPWIRVTDVATVDRTCRLLFDAIDQLHALTPHIADHPVATDLPQWTLDRELTKVAQRQGPWTGTHIYQRALEVLHEQVPRHRLPLVFSNGDYNPLNVLATDVSLIGWVDFEFARLEDPLIGLPKFSFWADDSGWRLASQVGLVERFLFRHQVDPATFMVRVALRGLTHLLDTTPQDPPLLTLRAIEGAISTLRA
jgi:aminoglycoside phosphotransferase (APT) family kinase protein